ncbi:MAG TPA: hypothetical protein VFG00_06940, partial [Acidothermaceae bacterium]|nr:hypothetical protein [Acidothermaceae bacterium]
MPATSAGNRAVPGCVFTGVGVLTGVEAAVNQADEDDFRAFVVGRSAALLNFAHLLTGDRQLAEDVVQTALSKTALAWSR